MHRDPSFLQFLWFVLIGVLWAGYFVLEGFDFGVGMLVRGLGRDRGERRMIIHTIGPVWDGNEVWLLVAGGATFAAFPDWYASAFSGFYLALFLVLVSLIIRGVSFEFWGKVPSERWRSIWEWALAISSGAAALLFGVAWANFIHGVPMGPAHEVHVTLFGLLHPYALLGGLTTLTLFAAHGANFLSLRLSGEVQRRADAVARRLTVAASVVMLGFLIWTVIDQSGATSVVAVAVVAAIAAGMVPVAQRRSAVTGFTTTAVAILMLTVVYMVSLYPNALPSTTSHAYDLTLANASSSPYTLTVMTVVAAIFVPVVLCYQAWTYWVFRHRLGADDYEGPLNPLAVIDDLRASSADPSTPAGTGKPPSAPAA